MENSHNPPGTCTKATRSIDVGGKIDAIDRNKTRRDTIKSAHFSIFFRKVK